MTGWDATAAEWYAENFGEYATNRLAVDALDLTPDVILDVGCGTGPALRRASERWPGCELIGVDPVPRMVEIARERVAAHPQGARIDVREGSAESIPLEDASADLVLAFDSFDHWDDKPAGVAEVARVLTADGALVVVKDAGVPQEDDDKRAMLELFAERGALCVEREASIEADGVAFLMWVFRKSPPPQR